MADKQYNIRLGFDADTSKAKNEIQNLQKELNKLTSVDFGLKDKNLDADLYKATAAVKEFQIHLQKATDVDTGKLDLSKLSSSLKASGKSLKDYSQSFLKLGPEGQKAFNSVTQSIMNAEVPLRRTNKLLNEMAVSLKNTIKWQISSSAVHAFMGAVQGAYGYVQDLDKSLNNIRIVTGRSADEMASFAKKANKAARELSVSTTTYTDAALIYYQQGLDDQQVKERTDATIKMANVTGENATSVSSYMTAIWNNFDDGSKSLEYFGDVITALGAKTAASSEEIAGGLEKFAAIGETIGLSYEYATAALTTIIDKTRQSEDVVGTALKTIFARIQGLRQDGETDDGVTLNKYSQALANVGISIMDNNGELKKMDDILDEMGSKWETLTEAQQVALAQTVGGTRQYTQLIALMDNWGSMQENLSTAYNSSGTLEEQAEIYAESWEAAQKRVTSALQKIYSELLNDKFFIGVTNMVGGAIELFGKLIDTVGGLPGVLAVAGVAMAALFKDQIPQLLRGTGNMIKDFTGASKAEGYQLKEEAAMANKELLLKDINDEGLTQEKVGNRYAARQSFIVEMEKSNKYSKEEIELYKQKIELEKQWGEEVIKRAKASDNALAKHKEGEQYALDIVKEATGKDSSTKDKKLFVDDAKRLQRGEKLQGTWDNKQIDYMRAYNESLIQNKKLFKEAEKASGELKEGIDNLDKVYADNNQNLGIYNDESQKYLNTMEQGFVAAGKVIASFTVLSATGSKIFEVLNDDSMSIFNKIEAIVPMLLVAIPALVSGIQSAFAATVLFNAEGKKGILIKVAELLLEANYNKELKEELTLKSLLVAVQDKLEKKKKQGILTKTAHWIVTKMLGDATAGAAGATLGLGAAIANLVVAALPFLVIGGLLIGIFFALKANSPEEKLKKSREELEKSQKAAQDAANAYSDLKSSLDSLKSAQDTLSNLTKGTMEWKEAVLKVNQQVLDLIEKYPELAQYMTNTDGVLGISEEGMNKVLDQKINEANSLQRAALSDQRNVAEAENNIQNKSFSIASNGAYITKDRVTKIANNLKYDKNGNFDLEATLKASGFTNVTENFKQAIKENLPALEGFKNNLDAANLKIEKLDEGIAKTWLSTHATEIDSETTNFIATGMSKIVGDIQDRIEKDYDLSDSEAKEAYARSILGPSAIEEEIQDYIKVIDEKIKNDELSMETIKESIISNAANYEAYIETQNRIARANEHKDEAGYDIVKNILASGGDASSFNALDKTEYDQFKQMAFDENGKLREEFRDMFSIFGEDFIATLEHTFSDANKEQYEKDSEANQEKLYQQKMQQTAASLGVDPEALEAYANSLQKANKNLKDNKEAALAAAEANIRWNKGINNLSDVLSDNMEALSSANKSTWDYYQALAKVQTATKDLLGIDVSIEYVKAHLGDLQKAVEGDETAIKNLQKTAAVDWAYTFVEGLQNVQDEEGKLIFDANKWAEDFTSIIDEVAETLGSLDTDVHLGADSSELDAAAQKSIEDMIELANTAMAAGQMTEGQMREMFGSMGYSPEVTYREEQVENKNSGYFKMGLLTLPYENVSYNTVKVPQIADKNSDGNVSLTKITTAKSLGGSTKKPKSSGSSGSVKEAERYHEIKKVIEDLEKDLDALGKAKDRAFGKDKIALMNQEIAKLQDMKAAQEQYLTEIEKFYEKDKKAITKFGAKFDDEGRIINYDELMAKYGSNETAMKALEQYEETYDLLKNKQQEIIDIQNQIYDAALEKTQYKVDLKIDVNSDDLKFLEYLLDNLTDSAYDAADAIANLGQQTAAQLGNQEAYIQGINNIFKEHGLGEDATNQFLNGNLTAKDLAEMNFTDAEFQSLRNYRDGLLETNKALQQMRDEVWNRVMEAITALGEEFDKQSVKIDHVMGVLDSYRNIVDLVGQDVLGISDEMMESFSETAVNGAIDALTVSKAKVDTLKEEKESLLAAQAETVEGSKEWKKLQEQIDGVDEQLKDAENEMLSDWESALEAANKAFEESVDRALKNFEKAMAGAFSNMKTLEDEFNKTRELDDIYLDDYKQIYELSKLTRDINKSIDDTDNIAAKSKLRDLQKEINALQESGVELSQYDIDQLRAKYDLKLAEIALEDAQNAKNQVRMTRDSEGNWSYTYTADQDNIDSAQQNYEDKLYALQDLNSNYIKDLESQILGLSQSMMDEIAAIDRTAYASEEEYNAEVQRITNFYKTKMENLSGEMDKAFSNNQILYDNDWRKYSESTGYKISADSQFLTSFGETTLGIQTGFDTMQEYQETFNAAIGDPDTEGTLLGDSAKAYSTWKTRVDAAMGAAGTSVEDFREKMETELPKIKKETDDVADSMDNEGDPKGLKQKAKEAFKAALKAAQDFEKKYGPEITKIIDDNTRLITSLNSVFNMWSKIKEEANNATTAAQNYNKYASNPTPVTNGDNDKLKNNPNSTLTNQNPNYSSSWDGWSGTSGPSSNNTNTWSLKNQQNRGGYYTAINQKGETASAKKLTIQEKRQYPGKNYILINGPDAGETFDTGGYTGEWGSSGRLAILHEKELVLNADDTKNMFSVVNAVRDIAKSIDLNANVGLGLGNLISAMIPSSESNLNQNIEIRAEFPYATDRNEIEAAFDNLINRASQYANRK